MTRNIIRQLINGDYIFQGRAVHVPVKSVRIEPGLLKSTGDLIRESGLKGMALLVCDASTHVAAAGKIEAVLGNEADCLILAAGVKADMVGVSAIKAAATGCDYIIAVGSGTINDLCKCASFLLNKPYVIFGTAPSMNGYASANASITINGHKKTLAAQLPQGIFLDTDVLAKAPGRLIRSGLADSLCRSTAQADWQLAHLLTGSPYLELPFTLLCDHEAELMANSAALVRGNKDIIRQLAETLVLSGFGMYLAGGSYPASQGEHMIAHTMEMLYGDDLPQSYHGEQIGVTTLTMARLQEKILDDGLEQHLLSSVSSKQLKINDFPNNDMAHECQIEYQAKQLSEAETMAINRHIALHHAAMEKTITAAMLPCADIYNALSAAGCPVIPQDIGWQDGQYNNAVRLAKFTRSRFTFLDLIT